MCLLDGLHDLPAGRWGVVGGLGDDLLDDLRVGGHLAELGLLAVVQNFLTMVRK
jgi:hypothetical protein